MSTLPRRARWAALALSCAALLGGLVLSPPAWAATCTQSVGGTCGAYSDSTDFAPSNGFNTYVANQDVGAQTGTTQTLNADGAASWNVVANDLPLGYGGVQTYPNTNQLFNNWDSSTSTWGPGTSDTPLTALSAIQVTYNETSPGGASGNNGYEFSPDVWTSYSGQLGSGSGDIMFWADTSPIRCTNNGLSSANILGQITIGTQHWTVYRYGPWGGEIVFVLNSVTTNSDPVGNGTCATQASGTIDVKAGIDWLIAHGEVNAPLTMSQLNTGWEITSADNATFTMNSLSYTTTVGTGEASTYAPNATTDTTTGISQTGATLTGSVLPEGQATNYQFDYGTSTSYGSSTTSTSAGSGTTPVDETAALTGLQADTTYHYRIDGTNATGTSYGADKTFTTPSDNTYSLWKTTTTPGNLSADDPSAVELGTRFTPSQDGQVDGVRFYKGSTNTGTHTGSLWSNSGTLLGSVTFTGETASGWQTAEFANPIPVKGGTTYVISYHAPNGNYSYDYNVFTSALTSGPLTAPADATGAGNGVFTYGGSSQFPTTSFDASSYYVDAVYQPTWIKYCTV